MRVRVKNKKTLLYRDTCSVSLNSRNLTFLTQGFHNVDFWADPAEGSPHACLLAFPGTTGQYNKGTAGGERGMLIAEPTSLDPHKIWEIKQWSKQ